MREHLSKKESYFKYASSKLIEGPLKGETLG